jgi:hypothetical protein
MFVFSGICSIVLAVFCPLDVYGFAGLLAGAYATVSYLRMADEARYF